MARRADHSREELTGLAIEAGRDILIKEGFSGFSARKVAAKIGYTVGTLYNVFGSYDEMILQINARTLDDWFAFMTQALAKHRSKGALHALAKAYIEYSRTHYPLWRVLFEYQLEGDKAVPDWYAQKLARFFTQTEEELQPLLGKDKKKVRRAAHVLWAGIHGVCVLSLSGKLALVDAEAPEVLALSFIDHYMAGLTGGK